MVFKLAPVANAATTAWRNSEELFYMSPGAGTWEYYYFDVPAGQVELNFDMIPFVGSPKIYINHGTIPLQEDGSDSDDFETTVDGDGWLRASVASPTSGTWYFGVYSPAGTEVGAAYARYPLIDGTTTSPMNLSDGDAFEYYVKGITTGNQLEVETNGDAAGDVDLGLYDFNYTDDEYSDGYDAFNDAHEYVNLASASVTEDYYMYVYANSDTDNFVIRINGAHFPSSTLTTIYNGADETTGPIVDGNWNYYEITVPNFATNLTMTTSGGTGTSVDLYHEFNALPTTGSTNKSTTVGTNTESITVASPVGGAGVHYVGVYSDGGDVDAVELTVTFLNRVLTGSVVTNIDIAADEWAYFTYDIPANSINTSFGTYPTADPVDIYVKSGDFPTTSDYDWKSSNPTYGLNNGGYTEQLEIINEPDAATYYIGIKGTTQSDNLQLTNHYVIKETSKGTWTDQVTLHEGNEIGMRVAADGDNVVVLKQNGEGTNSQIVNFYKSDGTLTGEHDTGFDDMGGSYDYTAAAIDGDYAVVGYSNLYDSGSGFTNGAIRIYETADGGSTWTFDQEIASALNAAHSNARFGKSVAISGDYIAVGEPGYSAQVGIVYIYKRNGGTGVWELFDTVVANGLAGQATFGSSLDVSGEYLIVGAENYSSQDGAAQIFKRGASDWDTLEATFNAEATDDGMGTAVAIDGTTGRALVTADGYGSDGKAYFYDGPTTWVAAETFEGDAGIGNFGYSADMDGDYAIVGSYSTNSSINGYASVYKHASPWSLDNKFQQTPGGDDNTYGMDVAIVGDSGSEAVVIADTGFDESGEPFGFTFFLTPASSSGGVVPEFRDYLLMITVVFALYFMFRLLPKIRGGSVAKT